MSYNINKRVFGADIDSVIKRKLAARQQLSMRAPLSSDEKFKDDVPYYLEGSGLSANDKPIHEYTPSNFKGTAELSSRKPFARMWIALDVLQWNPDTLDPKTYSEVKKLRKQNASSGQNQTTKYLPDLENSDVYYAYKAESTLERVYIIGNNQYGRTNKKSDVLSGQFVDTQNPILTTFEYNEPGAQPANTTINPDIELGDILPPELYKNTFLKDMVNIKNVTTTTEGSLGLIKNTKVEFVVANWNDFDSIIFPFFMQPGGTVHIDYGWDIADLYEPECLVDFQSDWTCPEEWVGKTVESKIYGRDGVINKGIGDVDVIAGKVVGWNASYATNGTINCSIELVSQNSALLGGDFDDIHDKFRDMIIQDLDEMFITQAFSQFLPALSAKKVAKTKSEKNWIDSFYKTGNNITSLFTKIKSSGTDGGKYGVNKNDIDVWEQIGSGLFRLAHKFLSHAPATGFGGWPEDDEYGNSAIPIQTGVYYRRGNEKLGFSADNLYVSWGRFEDEILNTHYGFGDTFSDIIENGNHGKTQWNSSDSYTRWNEDLVERQLSTHEADKLPFLIPSYWGFLGENDGIKLRSYSYTKLAHPGFDHQIYIDGGMSTEAVYDHNQMGPELNNIEYFHNNNTIPGDGFQHWQNDKGKGKIPLREIFIRVDVIRDAMKENNNLKEAVAQILDTINDSSAEVWNWKMGTNSADSNIISIIDANFIPNDNKQEDPQGKNYNKLFMFKPYSPNTIVKNFDFKFSTPSDEITSMLAVQGQSKMGETLPASKVIDEQIMNAIDWNKMKYEDINASGQEGFLDIRYNPNPITDFDASKTKHLLDEYQKHLNENRAYMLTEGNPHSSDYGFDNRIFISTRTYEKYVQPNREIWNQKKDYASYDPKKTSALSDIMRSIEGDEDVKGEPVLNDESDESTANQIRGVFNYYTEKIKNNFFAQDYSSILPATLTMDIYGTSGIYNGDCFRIDALPKRYRNACYFQVTKVKQNIDPASWTTSLETVFRIKAKAKKQVYPSSTKWYLNKKSFSGYRNLKKLYPFMTEIQPVSRYFNRPTLYSENLFTFKCKLSCDEIITDHMPKVPMKADVSTKFARAQIGLIANYARETQTSSFDVLSRGLAKIDGLVAALDPKVRKTLYTDAGAVPGNIVTEYKNAYEYFLHQLVEGEANFPLAKSLDGYRFLKLPRLPFDNENSAESWRDNWTSKNKFESRFKLQKDKQYYLLVRKPYWYIFEDTVDFKLFEQHFDFLQMHSAAHASNGIVGGAIDMSSIPNLTSKPWDMIQGREYKSFEEMKSD